MRQLSEFELASRLSYFLWSSTPDDALLEAAYRGTLRKEGNLDAQVQRMLKDPKAHALVENFAGQWLELRMLKAFAPDTKRYPGFDESLRAAMVKETELFFASLLEENRSVLDFDADYTFANARLAKHYGIADVSGDEFRRVTLSADQRGGLLGQASVLALTSNPTRTSPVKRGRWVLENLLGTPPPPPPADVPALDEKPAVALQGTLRQRLEQHRAKADCNVCHKSMDPLGFGLENYDAIGGWRTHDGESAIDASGTLPGGRSFNGPRELKAILKERQTAFTSCLAEKLLTYALGRGLEYDDRSTIDDLVAKTAKDEYRFQTLLLAIIHSDPFQKRRVPGGQHEFCSSHFAAAFVTRPWARPSRCRCLTQWLRCGCGPISRAPRTGRPRCRGAWPLFTCPTACTCPIGRRSWLARISNCRTCSSRCKNRRPT